jgi:hypothetical protein
VEEQQAPVEEQQVPVEEQQQAPVEEQQLPVEEEQQAPVEEQQVPVEEQQVPVEEQQAPVEEQQAPVEEQQVPVEEQQVPVEQTEFVNQPDNQNIKNQNQPIQYGGGNDQPLFDDVQNADIENKDLNQEDMNDLFLEQAYKLFQSTTQQSLEIAGERYKGYVSLSGNTYIAVFDYNDLEMPIQDDSIWSILYEIKSKNRILDIPVADFTYQLFYETPAMSYITNSKNRAIEIPTVVYICEDKDGSYDNSYYLDDESREQSNSIINIKINHPVLGNCFLFTSEPFEINNLSKIKRYALFSMDVIYLLNKDIDLTEYPVADLQEYESLCFYENGVEYWAIDNSDLFSEL